MSNTLGSKKLYRVPEEGMVKGVCAGLAIISTCRCA